MSVAHTCKTAHVSCTHLLHLVLLEAHASQRRSESKHTDESGSVQLMDVEERVFLSSKGVKDMIEDR